MTAITDIDAFEGAVATRMAEQEATPAAETQRLVRELHERLDGNAAERARHGAETEVLIERVREEADRRFQELATAETAIRQDLKRNLEEQERVRSIGAETTADIKASRAGQMAELERQNKMFEAALAAAAETINRPEHSA